MMKLVVDISHIEIKKDFEFSQPYNHALVGVANLHNAKHSFLTLGIFLTTI